VTSTPSILVTLPSNLIFTVVGAEVQALVE
jgi:hypothetical protein